MKTRPKAIGTRGETAAVRWLQENGWPDAERQPLRGTRDTGDLVVCRKPLIVAEVKSGAQAENASAGLIGSAPGSSSERGSDEAAQGVRHRLICRGGPGRRVRRVRRQEVVALRDDGLGPFRGCVTALLLALALWAVLALVAWVVWQ